MDMSRYLPNENEKPLDHIAVNGGYCRIFRKIACIGDSLSSGEFQIKRRNDTYGYYDKYEYSWGQHIARMTGSTVYNFSAGGMTARQYCGGYAEYHEFWMPDKACQAYIIALGVNDKNDAEHIGTIDDIDFEDYNNNKESFVGYYAKIVQRYKEIQPRAKFFFVTQPKETDAENIPAKLEVNARIREMAECFDNAYLIDLYEYGPVYDEKVKEALFMHNHMNPAGYVFTADMIASYIDYIIRNNPKDFEEIGFIGTKTTNYVACEDTK